MEDDDFIDDFLLIMQKQDFDQMLIDFKEKHREVNNSTVKEFQEAVSNKIFEVDTTYKYIFDLIDIASTKRDENNFIEVERIEHFTPYVLLKTEWADSYVSEKHVQEIINYLYEKLNKRNYYLGLCGSKERVWHYEYGDTYLHRDIFHVSVKVSLDVFRGTENIPYKLDKSFLTD